MRGLTGRLWLAAAAAMLLDVAMGDSVQFEFAGFDGGLLPNSIAVGTSRKGVFQATPGGAPISKTFKWTAIDIKIEKINLVVQDITGPRIIGQGSPANKDDPTVSAPTPGAEGQLDGNSTADRRRANTKRQLRGSPTPGETRIPLDVLLTATGGTITITDLSKFIQGVRPLYFEAIWPSANGKSYSPAFAVLDITDTTGLSTTDALPKLFTYEPFLPEQGQRSNLGSGSGSDTSPGSPTLGTAPMPTTTANDGGNGGTSGSVNSSTGLSTGATAGIGAACGVLGLLLIAFAIWYFLRKKKKRAAIPPYDETGGVSRTRTDELMAAEKEANLASSSPAAAVATYSDSPAAAVAAHRSSMSGGGGATAPLIAPVAVAGGAAVVAADGPPGYTPYTDRPASGAGSAGTGTAVGAGEEPAVVSREYAHLVEEGMTPEEIRRLEEEERALDAAIEQAVRRPTG